MYFCNIKFYILTAKPAGKQNFLFLFKKNKACEQLYKTFSSLIDYSHLMLSAKPKLML